MKCRASDCSRKAETKAGLCVMHYKRLKRNGSLDRVLTEYSANDVCQHCGKSDRLRKGLCNACRVRLSRKGYIDRDVAPHGDGTINSQGYRVFTVKGERVYHHRMVMEAKLGRPLLPGEVVHHKDGNKLNNEPENLELLSSQSEHMQLHRSAG